MIIYDKNNIERCEIKSLEYNGEFMGERFLSATIKSPFPIDFELGDYIDYRGERFTLNYDPSIIKKAEIYKSGEAFTYENVKFNSYADELVRCEFLDYVLNDNLIHFSSLPTFGFHALTIQDLADRIKANLDRVYPGLWTINVDSDVEVKNVFISADKLTIWGALALVSTTFKSNFIIRGRTITIGTAGNVIDNVFEYGKGKGLNKITKVADSEQQIITRLRVYGSTRNLPLRYYNKLATSLPNNMAVQNLMLPSFPYSTLNPYLDSPNIDELGVMEGSVFFDGSNDLPEIYPSIEGMTASQLISAGISVSLDSGDNGNLDEIVSITNEDGTPITDDGLFEEGETVQPFKLTIKDIGFDINDYLSGETATISLKTGMNGGREFEILSCEKIGNKCVLTCNRVEDVGRFFPYSSMNIKAGDKFVLLNIEMPEVYIKAASQRLLLAGQEYLSKNDYVRYTYQVNISPVYMARNPIDLIEGDYLLFTDTDLGISGSIIIDTLRIKDDGAPTYEVTLTEEKQVGTLQKLQNQINYLLSGSGGSVDLKQTESLIKLIGSKQFLSRVNPDTANKIITFLEGLEVGTFSSGALGSGAAIKMVNGTSYAEVDHLTVRQKATFRELIIEALKHIGGQLVLSPARMKCNKVVDGGTYYKCYFDTGDGEVSNEFVTGDQARCQVFTGSGTKFYWRLVTSVGEDWINLSKTDAVAGSDAPTSGDDISQLGNRTDTTRQSAIILSTVGADAPSWKQYSGINSFDLASKETTVFTRLGNRIQGKTVFTSGGTNLEDVLDGVGSDIQDTQAAANAAALKAQQAIEDAEANVTDYNAKFAAVQAQIDGEVSNWFYPYSPTLANYPASDWTTNEIKDRHIGDTFTNMAQAPATDAGKSWRFVKNGSVYSWTQIADSDAVKALLEASKAQATADGKSTTHLFQPTKYKLGDMWVLNADQTVNGTAYKQGEILTATQDSETFVPAHWLKRVRYTDDTAIDNLEIGGTNLLSGLNREYYLNNTGASNISIIEKNFNFKRNSEYVISYNIKGVGQVRFAVSSYAYPVSTISSDGQTGSDSGGLIVFPLTSEWKRVWIKIKTANWSTEEYLKLIILFAEANSEVSIRDIMFVSGNKAFDWSPAPEDVQAEIDDVSTGLNNLGTEIDTAFSNLSITNIEANNLDLLRKSLAKEVADVRAIAVSMSVSVVDIDSKISALNTEVNKYTGKADSAYPIEVKVANRTAIDTAFSNLEASIVALYEAIDNKRVNDIEIGGRNLITASTDIDILRLYGATATYISVANPSVPSGVVFTATNIIRTISNLVFFLPIMSSRDSFKVADGERVTVSFYIKTNVTQILSAGRYNLPTEVNSTWKKVQHSFIYPASGNLHYSLTGAGLTSFEVHSVKMERGNKATDWSPSPEDVQEAIPKKNLIHGGFTNGFWAQGGVGTDGNASHGRTKEVLKLETGKQYTFSILPEAHLVANGVWITFRNADNTYHSVLIKSDRAFTFTAPAPLCTISYNASSLTGYFGGDYFRDAKPMLVKGSYKSDWTEAPEDVDKKISDAEAKAQALEYLKLAIGEDPIINGALFTLVTILLKERMDADVTAGVSGLQGVAKNLPAFWAGGTDVQAQQGTAKAIIRHDGSSKFEETQVSGSIVAKQGDSGMKTELDATGIRVFNETGQINILFGMKNGYAVLEYYDNDGTFLYDLGPSGLMKMEIREEKWTVFNRISLGTDISTIVNSANRDIYKKSWQQSVTTYYVYTSKIVAGINQDPTNDGVIFTSMNKTGDRIPIGFYCKRMEKDWNLIYRHPSGGNPNQIINIQLPYIQTGNENVYDRMNICFMDLEYYVNGKRSHTNYRAYWNETLEGYPEI